jgi:hypothetical protein
MIFLYLKKIRIRITNDIINSYPKAWFAPLIPPIVAYFENEAQPADKNDNVDVDKIKKINKRSLLPTKLIEIRLKIVPLKNRRKLK